MYCKNCGKSIADDSKFCQFCGTLIHTSEHSEVHVEIIPPDSYEKFNFLGIKFSKKFLGFYSIWIVLHIILLVLNWDTNHSDYYYDNGFWPFSKDSSVADYSFLEFFFYTIIPIFIFIIFSFFGGTQSNKFSEYDLSYKKESVATTIGGISLLATLLICYLLAYFTTLTSNVYSIYYNDYDSVANAYKGIGFLFFLYKIFITVWVVNISKRQNRNSSVWGIFGFFFPSIALIIIGQLKKIKI